MTIEAITALALLQKLAQAAKAIIDLIANGDKKQEAIMRLQQLEKDIAFAESIAAKELGYQLCLCTNPPQIMLFTGKERIFKCPKCQYEVNLAMDCATASSGSSQYDGFM